MILYYISQFSCVLDVDVEYVVFSYFISQFRFVLDVRINLKMYGYKVGMNPPEDYSTTQSLVG